MKKIIKGICIVVGVLFIATPFVMLLVKNRLPKKVALTEQSVTSKLTNRVFPPSTYQTKAQQFIEQAQNTTDAKQTTQILRQALDTANEGIMLYNNHAPLYEIRARIYALLIGQVDDAALFAISNYQSAYAADPKNSTYLTEALAIAKNNGNIDQVVAILTKLSQHDVQNPHILLDLAQAQTTAGQIEDAIATYTEVLTLLSHAESTTPDAMGTITAERDALVKLVANQLADADPSSSTPPVIGGFAENSAPTAAGAVLSKNTSSAASGESVLTANQKTVTVETTRATVDSSVYVAPVTDTNIVLYVKSKTNGSFTVSVNKAPKQDVIFKWWVVQK